MSSNNADIENEGNLELVKTHTKKRIDKVKDATSKEIPKIQNSSVEEEAKKKANEVLDVTKAIELDKKKKEEEVNLSGAFN